MQDRPNRPVKGAWSIVGLAFIAQNFSIGLGIAGFGVLVLAIEQHYETNRMLASLGAAFILLAFGLFSPVAFRLIDRFSIRSTMMMGAIIASIGYLALSVAPNIYLFLAAYLFLVGPGTLFCSNFAGSLLINNWFPGSKGRAVGIMMIPFGVMIVPLLFAPLLQNFGLQKLYVIIAAVNLLLLPILYFVKDRPDGQADLAHPSNGHGANAASHKSLQTKHILQRADFWLLTLGVGLLNGSGMIKISHLVALTAEQGVTLADAGLLLAVSGGAGAVGSLFFGWLADKIGGLGALSVNAIVQACTWTIFLMKPSMTLMMVDAIIMGVAGAGVYSAAIVAKNDVFGAAHLAKVMGVSGPIMVIPNFLSPAVAGILRDNTGSYEVVLWATIASCLVSALCLLMVYGQLRKQSQPRVALA